MNKVDENILHKVDLRVCIWGFENISHNELSHALGVKPTKSYFKNELKNPKSTVAAKENGWIWSAKEEKENSSFYEQLQRVKQLLSTKIDFLSTISKSCLLELSCAVFLNVHNENDSLPSIHLAKEDLDFFGDIKMEFDIDLYFVS